MKLLHRNCFWFMTLILFSSITKAQTFQNLVPNGSFETYTQCPIGIGELFRAAPWTSPMNNSSWYFNACSPIVNVPHCAGIASAYPCFLNAQTGVAYSGLIVYALQNFRQYAQIKLSDTLKPGNCYYVEFYAANNVWTKYRINNIAACFSASMIPVNLPPPGNLFSITQHITNYNNPVLQDTLRWGRISGIYEAVGNETHLIIGNFKDDSHTDTINIYPKGSFPYSGLTTHAEIYVDAVSVFSINPNGALPWSYRDTTINKGDSVYIGNKMGGLHFFPQWFNQNGSYIKTNAGITISPTITSKYYVQYTLCGVQRTDTVKVTVMQPNEVALEKLKELSNNLKIYPQPVNEVLNVEIEDSRFKVQDWQIEIMNNLGQIVREEDIEIKERKATINTKDLEAGIYLLKLKMKEGMVVKKFMIE